jgi:hypothetical protein
MPTGPEDSSAAADAGMLPTLAAMAMAKMQASRTVRTPAREWSFILDSSPNKVMVLNKTSRGKPVSGADDPAAGKRAGGQVFERSRSPFRRALIRAMVAIPAASTPVIAANMAIACAFTLQSLQGPVRELLLRWKSA